jgi:phosphohistidine phosphatase
MEIYILRHGIAEEARGPDSDRALTAEGKKKLKDVLRVARQAEVSPSVILTSPFRRAVETAEIAADVLGCEDSMLTTDALLPTSPPEEVWREIRAHKGAEQILVVGHEPLLGCLVAFLLGFPAVAIDLKKGGLARVTVDQFGSLPRGVLKWLVPPKLVLAD